MYNYGRIKEVIMIGRWESDLNISPRQNLGENIMNLENILININKFDNVFSLTEEFTTIRYITKKEYETTVYKYVEPNFFECKEGSSSNPKFIIFSAPGATGKTALAQHICYKKNGIYWDLPDTKVAEYSFNGTISKAIGYENMSNFIKSIENGENFFVIDAFDEAEVGSGRSGIEFFLRDLNNVTQNCHKTCCILMARTESAIFIKNYLINNKIPFKHYEIGLFSEHNAKTYIKNKMEKLNVKMSNIVDQCIDEQFREIRRIFTEEQDASSFIGYAPVLDALATAYDDEKNTLKLLKTTENGENSCSLMTKILNHLLKREQSKFRKALEVKVPNIINEVNNIDELYNTDEQLNRILGKILVDDTTIFADIVDSVPIKYNEEYLEAINTQLPQHPYIRAQEYNNDIIYDFAGTAFRDFVLAYSIANDTLSDFVKDYLLKNNKYCPSQLLIEFYNTFSSGKISGKYIYLMYDSFSSFAQLGDNISIYINGNKRDCSIEFCLVRANGTLLSMNFDLIDLQNGLYINQLANCYIDIDGDINIGNSSCETRINNSTINCNKIIWGCENVSIEAFSPGECVIITNQFDYTTISIPKFEIKTDDKNNLKISSPSINKYYKLLAYNSENIFESNDNDFVFFANLIRRIFSCLRSHSKDTPARKMDFIDNRIVSTNYNKKNILNFLLYKHILYTDEQAWLYKLDTNTLSVFSINWNEVRDGNYDSLNDLYKNYIANKDFIKQDS